MTEAPSVEFFFSPGSRYSYLAASQIPSIEAETGCVVDWRPVNGADIRALRGRDPFAGESISGQYDWAYRRYDAELWADYYGIPFREPPTHRFDFKLLVLAATASKRLGAVREYGWRLCSTVYGSDTWPIDESVCLRLAADVGLQDPEFSSVLRDPKTERLAAAAAEEAYRKGAFGVPTFFLGGELFWGNDRIVILKHVLSKRTR
jgi:2-hydroxychromene-2-carboxylate isomerase